MIIDLIPLNELKLYIEANKYLPKIQTKQDVLENNVDLGEMNKLLLKKVDELTLYKSIEQYKRIKALKMINNKNKIMKKITKTFLLVISTLFLLSTTNSCKKIFGPKSCTWEKEITNMNILTGKMKTPTSYDIGTGLYDGDYCKYNLFRIAIIFGTEYLPNKKVCDKPNDLIIGKVKNISVISINDYNQNYKANDTINNIITTIYSLDQDPVSLQSYLQEEPSNKGLFLFLSQPPDTTNLQKFIIIYEEDNGNKYVDTTKAVYITP